MNHNLSLAGRAGHRLRPTIVSRCLPSPTPPIRPACLAGVDPTGGGNLYGANIIDAYTRKRGPAADVFRNVSTWHPYSVVLVKTRVTPE